MMPRPGAFLLGLTLLLAVHPAAAQESADFKIKEYAFNAAGHPEQGIVAASASFRVTLDALGDAVSGAPAGSASFRVETGFAGAFAPPGEVANLRFSDAVTLAWDPEASTGTYNLYRGAIGPGLGSPPVHFGDCYQSSIVGTTAQDPVPPVTGTGWFYIVTASNLLGEEGTKGRSSDNTPQPNPAPCP
jgi:hypothetical protein